MCDVQGIVGRGGVQLEAPGQIAPRGKKMIASTVTLVPGGRSEKHRKTSFDSEGGPGSDTDVHMARAKRGISTHATRQETALDHLLGMAVPIAPPSEHSVLPPGAKSASSRDGKTGGGSYDPVGDLLTVCPDRTFPRREDVPSHTTQNPRNPTVACHIPRKLGRPIAPVGFGGAVVLRASVPEAAVHEDSDHAVFQCDVWSPGETGVSSRPQALFP